MEQIFTLGAHVVYINQNMYCQGKYVRNINLNTHFLVLFKKPRDASHVACLARQIYPTISKAVIEAYQDCMKKKYVYLLIDLSPHREEEQR